MLLTEAENDLPGNCSSGQQQDTLVKAAESTAQSLPLLCSQGLTPRAKESGCVTHSVKWTLIFSGSKGCSPADKLSFDVMAWTSFLFYSACF